MRVGKGNCGVVFGTLSFDKNLESFVECQELNKSLQVELSSLLLWTECRFKECGKTVLLRCCEAETVFQRDISDLA